MKLNKFEIEEIWSWRYLKLKKFKVEEISSWRNFKLKKFQVEEILSFVKSFCLLFSGFSGLIGNITTSAPNWGWDLGLSLAIWMCWWFLRSSKKLKRQNFQFEFQSCQYAKFAENFPKATNLSKMTNVFTFKNFYAEKFAYNMNLDNSIQYFKIGLIKLSV